MRRKVRSGFVVKLNNEGKKEANEEIRGGLLDHSDDDDYDVYTLFSLRLFTRLTLSSSDSE